jgi:DNA mismatch repair protein MutS
MTDRLDPDSQPVAPRTNGGEFGSILFGDAAGVTEALEPPFFADLILDQAVGSIVAGRDEYDLKPFFYTPLHDVDTVEYRHAVFHDLECGEVRAAVSSFAAAMQRVRRYLVLAEKQHYAQERQRWFLDAAEVYCDAVSGLTAALGGIELSSSGMRLLRDHLAAYSASDRFASLSSDARAVLDGFTHVKYTVRIKGGRVTVGKYEAERDYTVEVEETFARFRQGQEIEDHLVKIRDSGSMDHVEAGIVQLVARLYPDEFRALAEFAARWPDFVDARLARFDREVQFYVAYLEHAERLRAHGLPFCYPVVSGRSKETSAEDAFDLALAGKLVSNGEPIVRNGFFLRGPERILVVTGPNQGGKTTFARMFGQLHHLAGLGVPVPGRSARLFLPDRVFTHFEVEEDIATLRGKLDEELVRIRDILEQASADSVVVLNEIFASTTLADAVYLGTEVLTQIGELGCLATCVTFVDELASLGPATASMVAAVAPDDPSRRTFEIVRRPADGRAYAWALADKYGLSRDRIRSRVSR